MDASERWRCCSVRLDLKKVHISICLNENCIVFHKKLPFGQHTACWNEHRAGRTTSVHWVLTPTYPPKTTLLLRPGKGFSGWWAKKIWKQLNRNRICTWGSGCCTPTPEDLRDATEVSLKRERMREQLFSLTTHTAQHDFPLKDWVKVTTTPWQPAKLSTHAYRALCVDVCGRRHKPQESKVYVYVRVDNCAYVGQRHQ